MSLAHNSEIICCQILDLDVYNRAEKKFRDKIKALMLMTSPNVHMARMKCLNEILADYLYGYVDENKFNENHVRKIVRINFRQLARRYCLKMMKKVFPRTLSEIILSYAVDTDMSDRINVHKYWDTNDASDVINFV